MSKRILTAFFSMTGETLEDRKIVFREKGHAALVAEYIQEAVGGDLFEIQTVTPYPEDHYQRVMRARKELEMSDRPMLKGLPEHFREYDTIFLCFPIWCFTIPMPVASFLEQQDWSGKTVIPVNTSNSSGTGYGTSDIRKLCGNANVTDGIALKGQNVECHRSEIMQWILEHIGKI